MKRIISAILCVVMLLCILPMSVFAQDKATPLILVQGYSGPSLFMTSAAKTSIRSGASTWMTSKR